MSSAPSVHFYKTFRRFRQCPKQFNVSCPKRLVERNGGSASEAVRREKNGSGENQRQEGGRWSWQRHGAAILAVVWPCVRAAATAPAGSAAAPSGSACRVPDLPGSLYLQEPLAMVMRPQMMTSRILSHGASRCCCAPCPMGGKGEEQEEEGESVFPHVVRWNFDVEHASRRLLL